MSFGAKLKKLREDKGLTQADLAKNLGTTVKTISNYEAKNMRPRKQETYEKIAEIFDVDINYLLTIEDSFILDSREKYGYAGAKGAEKAISSVTHLFAGGELPEEDMDSFFRAITEAYWETKEKNKKYGRRKKKD